ncbi:MAG: GTPase Era [Firmicutes bacterium]|nr:GTPase Era [Bacillota bacterium]
MKIGRVVLIGEPNVGKSSIVNAIVGEQVSVVTDVAGTTRGEILGIKSGVNLSGFSYQIIFLDTPGMLKQKKNLFDKQMAKAISTALASADIILYVLDATNIKDEFIAKIKNYEKTGKPLIIAVNKTDKTNFVKLYPKLDRLNKLDFVRAIIPTSCKTENNINVLESEIAKIILEHSLGCSVSGFDSELYTTQSVKEMSVEIIRGELLKNLFDEIPHGIFVNIAKWKETEIEIEIDAEIYCEKPSHKPIIIGKKGNVLKQIGISSRRKIEELVEKHVKLYTRVLVREDWKNKNEFLNGDNN